ncbi:MAG TPA: GNAT family N-acetyltransferase [Firmicutes bacterium]|nr:GNAT family N-acetyltransferase [Bacillota bacterium]
MIEYSTKKKVDIKQLQKLFAEAGWYDKKGDTARLNAMINNSQIIVTAWHADRMVGFARCITDNVFNGQINNVVVDSNYRGKGIGKELVSRIINTNNQVTYVLRGDPENEGFYKRLGFVPEKLCLIYRRKK